VVYEAALAPHSDRRAETGSDAAESEHGLLPPRECLPVPFAWLVELSRTTHFVRTTWSKPRRSGGAALAPGRQWAYNDGRFIQASDTGLVRL